MSRITLEGRHSIWLLAAPRDERTLVGVVRDLAARFGTPRFHPHLTLAGDLASPAAHLTAMLDEIVAGIAVITQPVMSVDAGEAFFRSFYARFEATEALATLRRRAHEAAGIEETTPFLPHVSLAYGVPEGHDKQTAQASWTGWLDGMDVKFDRIAVVRAAETVAIEDWTILATKSLPSQVEEEGDDGDGED